MLQELLPVLKANFIVEIQETDLDSYFPLELTIRFAVRIIYEDSYPSCITNYWWFLNNLIYFFFIFFSFLFFFLFFLFAVLHVIVSL